LSSSAPLEAIGSNLTQAALTIRLTPNVCMYDPFEKGLKGAAEEIYHCAFPGRAA
jgi:malate dehydrogenase